MSLLTRTIVIVACCCTLEVVVSHMVIPQPPTGIQYGPQDINSFPAGYQINNNFTGSQDGDVNANNKEGKNPYKMFYIEKDQFRCEECDEKGNIKGNMTYVDGKLNAIRTVKYETKDIPLDPNAQEAGISSGQSSFTGAQDAYQQQQFNQGQQLQPINGQQMYQGQQVYQGQQQVQGQQLQSLIQGQPLPFVQPQQVYQGQPIQAQGQNYQGNQAAFVPLSNYPSIPQQNPVASQLQVPLVALNQQSPGSALTSSNLGNNQYASTPSTSFPFALERPLPEAVQSGVLGIRPIDNRANFGNNQGPTGGANAGGYSAMELLAAEAIRSMQPQPTQSSLAAIQQSAPALPQPQVMNDNSYGSLDRRFNMISSNRIDDRPQGSPILSSPSYQQPLFSTTSTGVLFNREPNGAYNFEYKTPDTSRKEVADAKNNVIGSYAYRDPNGGVHNVEYNSGIKGFNAREQNIPGSPPAVMPAMILVPTQQPVNILGQQLPFTLVSAGNSPMTTTNNIDSSVDKPINNDDSAKPSDTDTTESMLQKLAKEIVDKMSAEKSGSMDGNISSQPTAEGEQQEAPLVQVR